MCSVAGITFHLKIVAQKYFVNQNAVRNYQHKYVYNSREENKENDDLRDC